MGKRKTYTEAELGFRRRAVIGCVIGAFITAMGGAKLPAGLDLWFYIASLALLGLGIHQAYPWLSGEVASRSFKNGADY